MAQLSILLLLTYPLAHSYTVCQTEECQNLSQFLKQLVDTSKDPCGDFYDFGCGRWKSEHSTLPPGRLQYGIDSISQERIDNVTRQALYAINPKDKKVGKAIRWARRFFSNCQAYDKAEDSSQDEVVTYLKTFADWPFFNPRWKAENFDLIDVVARMQRNLSLGTLVALSVDPDQFHPDRYALYLKEGQFVAESTFYNASVFPKFRARYLEIVSKTLSQLVLDTGTSHLKVRNVKKLAAEIYDFEASLANAVVAPGNQAGDDQKLYYNPMNISELGVLANDSSVWQRYFDTVFSKEQMAADYLANNRPIVTQPDYLQFLHAKLQTTPPHIPANYLMWRLLYDTLSEYVESDYLKIEKIPREQRVVVIKRISNIKQPLTYDHYVHSDKEQSCLYRTRKAYDYAVGRIYVDYQFTRTKLAAATNLTDSIHDAFLETLASTRWMTASARNRSTEKLRMMVQNVGYPEWILNDTLLEDHYKYYKVKTNSTFFQNSLRLSFFDYRKLFTVGSRYDFGLSVSTARSAGYAQSLNAITIPSGQLEYPYYDVGYSDAFNYATVGFTVAHEMSHGFDNIGIYFDGNGDTERSNAILGPWLLEGVNDTFNNLSQCLVDQYNNYCYDFVQVNKTTKVNKGNRLALKDVIPSKHVPEGPTVEHFCIDGSNTLSENFADLNGLRLAYKAFRSHSHDEDIRLPGFEAFSPDQLFFLSYAAGWCRSVSYGGLKLQLNGGDPHSPEDARVNAVLSNLPQFADAYKCAKDTPMGAQSPCDLY